MYPSPAKVVKRQRFTIAREISHLILDVSWGIDEENADLRFAAAFLMPEEAMWTGIGKQGTALGWAEVFMLKLMPGVSVQATTYRCKDLGFISQTLMGRMFSVLEEIGWRSPPHEEEHPQFPRRSPSGSSASAIVRWSRARSQSRRHRSC